MTLKLKCPDCERVIRTPFTRYATMVSRRKCRGCGQRWQIVSKPHSRPVAVITFNEFTRIPQ